MKFELFESARLFRLAHRSWSCLINNTSIEVNWARRPYTWSRPCAFEEKKRKKHEIWHLFSREGLGKQKKERHCQDLRRHYGY